jgi:hypothetical protein
MSHCDLSEHAKISITYNIREIYGLVFSSQLSLVIEPFNARNILPFSIATKHRLTTLLSTMMQSQCYRFYNIFVEIMSFHNKRPNSLTNLFHMEITVIGTGIF